MAPSGEANDKNAERAAWPDRRNASADHGHHVPVLPMLTNRSSRNAGPTAAARDIVRRDREWCSVVPWA